MLQKKLTFKKVLDGATNNSEKPELHAHPEVYPNRPFSTPRSALGERSSTLLRTHLNCMFIVIASITARSATITAALRTPALILTVPVVAAVGIRDAHDVKADMLMGVALIMALVSGT